MPKKVLCIGGPLDGRFVRLEGTTMRAYPPLVTSLVGPAGVPPGIADFKPPPTVEYRIEGVADIQGTWLVYAHGDLPLAAEVLRRLRAAERHPGAEG